MSQNRTKSFRQYKFINMSINGKRLIHQYSQESLKCALMEVRSGTSTIFGASKKYGVPSTIQDRIHGRFSDDARKMGPQTVLSESEEDRLEKMVQRPSKMWIPTKT
ncbi:hypothetical protein FF38_11567 [Lucilia cuprina]|uniref:HTH psq-type domain-containing protein n=1 Tax=Lucilia cuprina TaxID=7375 RepID=A0A0L0CDF1_LUCCU|nr:hypothetical protein FF38_11567 [Lucilia cuprina]